jgi:ABC-2 type transport system ATP-binding protein
VYGLNAQARSNAIDYVRRMTDLEGMEYRQVEDLSGAMRQRLALACSVLHRPAVLFLDEPTSGIDPRSRQRFWQLIQELARSGITVFITTHYLEEASYCDRLALMFQGRLVASGSIPQLRAALAAPKTATMEDIFMAYIERERTREAEPRETAA